MIHTFYVELVTAVQSDILVTIDLAILAVVLLNTYRIGLVRGIVEGWD